MVKLSGNGKDDQTFSGSGKKWSLGAFELVRISLAVVGINESVRINESLQWEWAELIKNSSRAGGRELKKNNNDA